MPETLPRLLRRYESPARLRHSVSVARLARDLCRRNGLPAQQGYLAGLLHDLARGLPDERLVELAALDGRPFAPYERAQPVLLHGRAAAVIVRRELGIEEGVILAALADHVTGRPGMGLLARIVFAADYLEPGRAFVDAALRRRALSLTIDGMVLLVLREVFAYLGSLGRPIAPPALSLYEELREHAAQKA
jgi:predicted HD superfamily hydrolase involved in NAD metabolism